MAGDEDNGEYPLSSAATERKRNCCVEAKEGGNGKGRGTYSVEVGVGLREECGEGVLVPTGSQMLCNNTVCHLECQGNRGRGCIT